MSMRNVLFCALIGLGPVAMPVAAAVNVSINLGVAPPEPRYELVPAPRAGYAWAPGFWQWDGQRHVWAQGHWIAVRPGFFWVADRWNARDGRHFYEPGHWEQGGKHRKGRHEGDEHGNGWAKGHDR